MRALRRCTIGINADAIKERGSKDRKKIVKSDIVAYMNEQYTPSRVQRTSSIPLGRRTARLLRVRQPTARLSHGTPGKVRCVL